MIEWKLEISKVDNGYLCEGITDNKLDAVWIVEEGPDDEYQEHETMIRLLTSVQQYFGVRWSKHNKKNCRVRMEDENGKVLEEIH